MSVSHMQKVFGLYDIGDHFKQKLNLTWLLSNMKMRKLWPLSGTSVHALPKWDILLIIEVIPRVLMRFSHVLSL